MEKAREPFSWECPGGKPAIDQIRTFQKYVEIQTRLRGGPGCLLELDGIFTTSGEEMPGFRLMVMKRDMRIAFEKELLKPFIEFL